MLGGQRDVVTRELEARSVERSSDLRLGEHGEHGEVLTADRNDEPFRDDSIVGDLDGGGCAATLVVHRNRQRLAGAIEAERAELDRAAPVRHQRFTVELRLDHLPRAAVEPLRKRRELPNVSRSGIARVLDDHGARLARASQEHERRDDHAEKSSAKVPPGRHAPDGTATRSPHQAASNHSQRVHSHVEVCRHL